MIIVETITGGVASRPHWNCSVVSFSRCMWSCVYKRRAYTCHHYFSYLASPCTTHPPLLPLPIRFSFARPLSLSTHPSLSFSFSLYLCLYPRSSLSLKYCRYEKINCTRLIRRCRICRKKDKAIFGEIACERMDPGVITDSEPSGFVRRLVTRDK